MGLTTLRFRIKDQSARKHRDKNGVFCQLCLELLQRGNQESWKKFRKTFSNYDLHKLTSGCGKDLSLHSQTIQAICDEYAKCCKQLNRTRLARRSRKRSLGWISFKSKGVKVVGNTITYGGISFKFWNSRNIDGAVRFGCFAQDAKDNWFLNLVVEIRILFALKPERNVE